MTKNRNEQDSAWKDILEAYLKACFERCFPYLFEIIDWGYPPKSLDNELQSITSADDAIGKRLVDKLFEVRLKNGETKWMLIHIEIQGKKDRNLPKRMLTYSYRIYDRYQKPVISCVILADSDIDWRPNSYKIGLGGAYLSIKFLVSKLIDYQNRKAELEASRHPFDWVILVQLTALEMRNKQDFTRQEAKFMLTRKLYEKGFSKESIHRLYKFIDWLIALPKEFEIKCFKNICELEELKNMPYITFAERYGIEQGMKQGLEKGAKNTILSLLRNGFDRAAIASALGLTLNQIAQMEETSSELT